MNAPELTSVGTALRVLWLALGAMLCVAVVHFPMIGSGFRLTQADLLDSRFNNYLLEHSYRWLTGAPGHESFWNPPFCYPAQNLLAHSDVMISFAPPYWMARAVGLEPDTAFQIWMLCATILNFLLVFLLLNRGIGVGATSSWCGAVLFTIASSRTAQLGHQQLYCQAYALIACFAVIRMFRNVGVDPHKTIYPTMLFGAITLQFWGGFYIGLFLVLTLAIALAWALVLPCTRNSLVAQIIDFAKRPVTLLILTLAIVSHLPLSRHYFLVAQSAAVPDDQAVLTMLPTLKSWLYMGPQNLVYGRLDPFYSDLPAPFEHAIGLGLFTTILAVLGLWSMRRDPAFLLLLLTSLTLIVLCSRIGDHTSLWWTVRSIVPGAVAIRAVARIGILLIIPASIGFGVLIERHKSTRLPRVALVAIVGLCFAEQLRSSPSYDKYAMRREVQSVAARIPPGTSAFFFTGSDPSHWAIDQVDAMWASLQTNIPTINGYSGTWPPAIRKLIMSDTIAHRSDLENELKRWRETNHLRVVWIVDDSDRGNTVVLSD
jgi:hypothetical protein